MSIAQALSALPSIGGMLNGGISQGESQQSGGGSSYGYNTAQSVNRSQSSGYSNTFGTEASNRAANAAAVANKITHKWYDEAMKYNAEQAQIQREWQERMANTIYTRSVANMREAGINPILAASMGLSGAQVGSGATASIATPSSFMGQTFADTNSANQAWSAGDSYSHGENSSSYGYSGSSWNSSENGLATGIKQMMELGENILNGIASSKTLEKTEEAIKEAEGKIDNYVKDNTNTKREEDAGSIAGWFGAKFKGILNDTLGIKDWKDLPTDGEMYQAIRHYFDDGWNGLSPAEKNQIRSAMNQGYISENSRKDYYK